MAEGDLEITGKIEGMSGKMSPTFCPRISANKDHAAGVAARRGQRPTQGRPTITRPEEASFPQDRGVDQLTADPHSCPSPSDRGRNRRADIGGSDHRRE